MPKRWPRIPKIAELDVADTTEVKEAAITGRDIAVVVLFLLQPIAALVLVTGLGMGTPATAATMIIMAIVIGLVHGFNGDQIGGAFAKGTAWPSWASSSAWPPASAQ